MTKPCCIAVLAVTFCVPAALLADTPSRSLVDQVEDRIVQRTNEFRKQHDLPAVSENDHLQKAAEQFAGWMAANDKYGHHADGRTPAERVTSSGYEYCVVRENIAYRTNPGEVTVESLAEVFAGGWIDSPPHRENMLADYVEETGVAVATEDEETYYAVQLFGRPKSAAIEIRITNRSARRETLAIEANDSRDEFEIPPATVMKLRRCFPSKLQLVDSEDSVSVAESIELTIGEEGLQRKPSEPTVEAESEGQAESTN
ncbi:CAP domain-containing protein [Roseiconus nitratireducens]|uniref:CAP domain-containing protein n=1 Tax=Roseiconus nitratireducens TaxID=2605748 RepID=A0A5M6D527_9BACT|nr:CAP domain-containing protein [Roseiconus nitratireducens]KAA5542591.1 CAP domain-containing protein [Roseiconus nitratireducens]